jgi:GDP-L-fucose synthase
VYLSAKGVENRPIISGNFARQPVLALHGINVSPSDLPGSEIIHRQGFFIGSHNQPVGDDQVAYLVEVLLTFPFRPLPTCLVTGATGLAGTAVQRLVAEAMRTDESLPAELRAFVSKLHFVFAGSSRADLRKADECERLFEEVRPQYVLHLAAVLSGIQTMAAAHVEYYSANSQINNNVLRCAVKLRVKKVVSCLSTVMLPADATYPVTEATIHAGAPNPVGHGYAMAKRELDMLSRWYSKESSTLCVCVLPSNIFGPGGDFSVKDGPFVHALIRKAVEAKEAASPLHCFGTGAPLRQMLYSNDLALVLLWALASYTDAAEPVNVAGPEVSIKEMAELIAQAVGFDGQIAWSGEMDGALRRTADMTKLVRAYGGEPDWTPLKQALKETVDWFKKGWYKRG